LTDSRTRLKIAHVEVGGTLGGSAVCVDLHLRFCDDLFEHELLFYSIPKEKHLECTKLFPVRDLGFPAPSLSATAHPHTSILVRFIKRFHFTRVIASESLQLLKYVRSIPYAFKLARMFRVHAYDLIHCNNNFDYQPATVVASLLARKPLVSHYRTPVQL